MYKKMLFMAVMVMEMSYLTSYASGSFYKEDALFFKNAMNSQLGKSMRESQNRIVTSGSSMESLPHGSVKKSSAHAGKNYKPKKRSNSKVRQSNCTCTTSSANESTGQVNLTGQLGVSKISAYMSAVSIASGVGERQSSRGTIHPGDNIKFSFNDVPREYRNLNGFTYDDKADTGVFISNAGPGDYLVIFGAKWQGNQTLVLMVDGEEFDVTTGGYGFINAPGGSLVTSSIVVHSNKTNPTFSIANASEAGDAMELDSGNNDIPAVSATLTVVKLN